MRLPITDIKDRLVDLISRHQVVVVVGETGSGKSSQLPQYLVDSGFVTKGKMLACTQPRRIAAVSLAHWVAEERGGDVGDEVGYTVRFEDYTSEETVIRYMTDGMLCMSCLNDKEFTKYSVIIVDEAHERSIMSDLLLAMVKKAVKKRPDLRLVITSATLDRDRVSEYFQKAPVLEIEGSLYPVNIVYCRAQKCLSGNNNVWDDLANIVGKIKEIHKRDDTTEEGILVFLPGVVEIQQVNQSLICLPGMQIIQVHASLPLEVQAQVFNVTPGLRKVVLATNVAETSLTVPGIKYVVDSGYFKENIYDPKAQLDRLEISPVCTSQAEQRTGRAGRLGPGVCYRMYSEKDFKCLRSRPTPAICRTDIVTVCLLLKAMEVKNVALYGFMDPPISTQVETAIATLVKLDALDSTEMITDIGKLLSILPVSPVLAKMLIISSEMGCSQDVLSLVSLLSVNSIYQRHNRHNQHLVSAARSKFSHSTGDHITLLNIWDAWYESGCCPKWSASHYLDQKQLMEADAVRQQLESLMYDRRLPLTQAPEDNKAKLVLIAIAGSMGAVDKVAGIHWTSQYYIRPVNSEQLYIHPSSVLFKDERAPACVIYQEIVTTNRNYMRTVSIVENKWII